MKIKAIAFANTVKVGRAGEVNFATDDNYDITLRDVFIIEIKSKRPPVETVYTSLFNTKWWHPMPVTPPPTPPTPKVEIPIVESRDIPPSEVHAMKDGEIVAKIENLQAPAVDPTPPAPTQENAPEAPKAAIRARKQE